MQSLDAELKELFATKDGQMQEDDGQTDFKKDELSEILHKHIHSVMNTPDTTPVNKSTSTLKDEQPLVGVVTFHFSEQMSVAPEQRTASGAGQQTDVNSFIHSGVWICSGLMNWWNKTQADSLAERVIQAIQEEPSVQRMAIEGERVRRLRRLKRLMPIW
ncbi:unnamed protein product [Lampetra planeri]